MPTLQGSASKQLRSVSDKKLRGLSPKTRPERRLARIPHTCAKNRTPIPRWREIIEMTMATTKFPVADPRPSCPWLVFNHGEKEGYSTQTFINVAQDRYDVASIPEMRNKTICTCSHGWLVLYDLESDDYFLLNPVSMEKITLPPAPPNLSFTTCILSSPPTDPDCVVLFFLKNVPTVIFLRPGESTDWTEQDLRSIEEVFEHAVVCGGKIYGFNFRGFLLTVKVVGSNLIVSQLGAQKVANKTIPEAFRFSYKLVESCGDLFAVVKYYRGGTWKTRDFEVYKMDFPRLEWVKVERLGNRAFFLSDTSCNFSCSTTTAESESGLGVKQNCIYFTEPEDRDLYVFDMESYAISFSTPCPIKTHWSDPLWVMPAAI